MNVTQRTSTVLAFSLAFGLAGCSQSAGGPQLAQLQISVFSDGTSAVEPHCARLPVLWGSRVQERVEVDETFGITTFAEREQLQLDFEGVNHARSLSRTLHVNALRDSYAEALDVVTVQGHSYVVNLSSVCE